MGAFYVAQSGSMFSIRLCASDEEIVLFGPGRGRRSPNRGGARAGHHSVQGFCVNCGTAPHRRAPPSPEWRRQGPLVLAMVPACE
jgi:hypothetical protein